MNAMKTNTACKALYERLKANGKTGKQALVAVMNKLLKQVFVPIAIGIKNNRFYQPNYCSAKP
jgi:transposase